LVPSQVGLPFAGMGHDLPQLPQVFGSVALTHLPWHEMKPLLHFVSHALFVQTAIAFVSLVVQVWQFGPQWVASSSAAHWALVPHW
jgi:hypothetical protein